VPHNKMMIFDLNKTFSVLTNGLFSRNIVSCEVVLMVGIHEECPDTNINTLHQQYDRFFTYTPMATPQWLTLTYEEFNRRQQNNQQQHMKLLRAENDALRQENRTLEEKIKKLEEKNKQLTLSAELLNFMNDEDIK